VARRWCMFRDCTQSLTAAPGTPCWLETPAHGSPLCQRPGPFPPVDAAPVLAGVRQIALDVGCESALGQGGGNGPEDGSGGRRWRA
jgi:hypothetical protein